MHINVPNCPKCVQLLDKYPGFHSGLREWVSQFLSTNCDAHISAAGRGRDDQELFFKKGTSRAHYGQSAHNWNAAVDFFHLTQAGGAAFDRPWYQQVLGPAVLANPALKWYGEPPISFLEFPHVEWRCWRSLAASGEATLVDGPSDYPIPIG
jgi:hypothetical protein